MPSSWRLVNLALGLAALLSFAGASGLLPSLVLSRWLLAPWFTTSSTAAVSSFAVLVARIGINLWLPASILMVLFWLAGLHRRVGAPNTKFASTVFVFAWVASMVLTIVPFAVGRGEGAGAILLVIGVFLAPVYLILIVVVVMAAVREFVAMFAYRAATLSRVPVALLLWAFIPPAVSVVPFLFAPSNPLAQSTRESAEFAALCQDVGVRLIEKPVAPVRSIAYDRNPLHPPTDTLVERIELDGSGRILRYGGGYSTPNSADAQKKLAFEFTEHRRDSGRAGAATINPNAPYYRFPASNTNQPYYGVDAFSADVLAFVEIDTPDELRKAALMQGALRYTLTLSDRRSGAVLGMQTYVVDQVNKRACGANIGNIISQNAFIYDAIHR